MKPTIEVPVELFESMLRFIYNEYGPEWHSYYQAEKLLEEHNIPKY